MEQLARQILKIGKFDPKSCGVGAPEWLQHYIWRWGGSKMITFDYIWGGWSGKKQNWLRNTWTAPYLSSRSLSAVIYLKVVGAHNHQTFLYYQTFGSKESYTFFIAKHLVVFYQTFGSKECNKFVPYISGSLAWFNLFWPSFNVKLGQNMYKPC